MPLKSAGKTITKIKQNKKTIDVYFGLEKISVPFDSYFDSFLYQGKLLTDKEYNDLIFASKNSSLYVYASTVLKKYKYTESMMREKLSIRETNEETVDKIIKKLKKALLIDDKAFIKDYLDLSEDKNIGKNRIIKFLRDKGIKEEDINNEDIEENMVSQVSNPARLINRTQEETLIRIYIQSYLNDVNDRDDKIAKRIQEFNEEELFAVCELAYEIAIKENLEDVEQAIKKAIFKVTTKPELVAEINEYKKERKLNQEKIDKFLKILREEIAKIGIFDENDLKEIGKPFMDKVNNVLIDDIDEDFVHAEIEKYL